MRLLIVDTLSPPAPSGQYALRHELGAVALLLLALGLAYAPTFAYLAGVWNGDANYSHGYLVVPIALAILWMRRHALDRGRVRPQWWGWVLLAAVFGLRSYFYWQNEQWFEDATLPLAAGSLALALGGWALFTWCLPAIIFLGFMFPLPHRLNAFMAFRLQQLATIGSCNLLQAMGLPVLAEGNVIITGTHRLEVAQACSGLRMLLSFLTLITAAAILVQRPLWDRIILLMSAIPIALVSNILRITTTALCYNFWGTDELTIPLLGYKLPHDWAGYYLMMPIGLLLVWVELKLLSWLVVEEPERVVLPTFGTAAPSVYRAARKEAAVEKEKGVDP